MDSGAQDGLFDESLVERVVPDPSLDEWLPEVHLARFIADLVESELEL